MLIRKDLPAVLDPETGFSMAAEAEHLIDDLARPFLELADKIEAARETADPVEWGAILDANVYIWRFVANYIPGQLDKQVCAELGETLKRIGDYMHMACRKLREARDEDLINHVIELNCNMCAQFLDLRRTMLGIEDA